MNTDVNKNINLFLKDGRIFVFEQYQNGLYFLDTHKSVETSKYKCELNNYSFLSIVYDTKKYFSQQEIKERVTSWQIQEYFFFPSSNILKTFVNQKILTNCKITADNSNRAEIVYGPSEPYLGGHMV